MVSRKVVIQLLMPKIRALLTLQPLRNDHADLLDKKLAKRIHDLAGFPYIPSSELLTLPVEDGGMGFPSIYRLNMSIATAGVIRDLNHHNPLFSEMAKITLADWGCSLSKCTNPFAYQSPNGRNTPYIKGRVPLAWISAKNVLRYCSLSIPGSNISHTAIGDVAIEHVAN